jgi:hypothetical protein
MANEFSTAAKNAMLDALTPDLLSLHSGDPGVAGTANEITGGGYVRKSAVFSAAANGQRLLSAVVEFDGPASQSVTHLGVWKNAGTVFYARDVLTGDTAFNASGKFSIATTTVLRLNDPA